MDAPLVRIAIALLLALAAPASAGERLTGRARVTDGDTISVGGVAVRLKGLAAPEVAHFGEPGGAAAKAFMVELVEGQTVVCDLTQERTHGRRVDYCYRDGEDIAEALVRVGLARDCPGYSGGQYAAAKQPGVAGLPLPSYCSGSPHARD
jgi:endonuclease YncB( thermonuclease family)